MDRGVKEKGLKPRPTLLSVLCFLSLLGSSWVMFQGALSAISPPEASTEEIDNLEKLVRQLPFSEEWMIDSTQQYLTNTLINAQNLGALNFLFGAVSLLGVYYMFRLQKRGFAIYSIAQVGLAASSVLMGGMIKMAWIYGGVSFFISLIFIMLYTTQLKYMR